MSSEVEAGHGERARCAYSPGDIALLPARHTRDPEDVNAGWQIDAYHVDIPVMAAPMDSIMSPQTAIDFGRPGGIGILSLNGSWTRYKDPEPILEETLHLSEEESIACLQQIHSEPIQPRPITECLARIRDVGVMVAGKFSPQLTQKYWRYVVDVGVNLLVIRGSTVPVKHVLSRYEPLNLERFICELDVPVIVGGVCTDTTALHLMRTGAAGALVGFGGGVAHSTCQLLGAHVPTATAIAGVAAVRRDCTDESGGRHVHVIVDGGIGRSEDSARATACGTDAMMLGAVLVCAKEAPGQGWHWGSEATHLDMPREQRARVGISGTLEQILYGPSTRTDGLLNFVGALKHTVVSIGYAEAKDLQKVEVVVSPHRPSETR